MQRTLAQRLRDRANGAYEVIREAEVADCRRTDIRISAPNPSNGHRNQDRQQVVGSPTHQALAEQLLSYLRDANCSAGCLLVAHQGDRKWHPRGACGNVDFRQLVGPPLHRSCRYRNRPPRTGTRRLRPRPLAVLR